MNEDMRMMDAWVTDRTMDESLYDLYLDNHGNILMYLSGFRQIIKGFSSDTKRFLGSVNSPLLHHLMSRTNQLFADAQQTTVKITTSNVVSLSQLQSILTFIFSFLNC